MTTRSMVGLVLVILSATTTTRSDANCARPITYEARVAGNTVEIEPVNFESRTCPDPGGMLRQDAASGAVVRIADVCSSADAGRGAAYVDECVPAGHYRYGFAKPYTCLGSACSTDYFVPVTVEQQLPADCARRPDDPGPTATAAAPPWKWGATICSYGGLPGGAHLMALLVAFGLLAIGGVATGVMLWRRRARG